MAEKLKISKTKVKTEQLDKVVDRSFKTFNQPVPVEDELTIEQFFTDYETLFNEIPIEGPTNSHEYLVKTSGELIAFEKDTEDIQPLIDEINQLREELLNANQQILELQTTVALNGGN